MSVQLFSVPFSEEAVHDLRGRLARTRWPDQMPGSAWRYGFDLDFLRRVCRYWQDEFDWKRQVERMDAFAHYRFQSSQLGSKLGIHFIHERGQGPDPLPLIITHGWPGSFLEILDIIPLLTDPERFGGSAADSFDVVVPSLPGFRFSDRPKEPGMSTLRVADIWADLMQELGYARFGAQGGDFGAAVTTLLALRHPERMVGIHLNYIPGAYQPHLPDGTELSTVEQSFLLDVESWNQKDGAYEHMQINEPQTPAYALNDSPSGLAAWILDKFRNWADCGGDLESRFSLDELLTNVTLYWMTETIGSSMRFYYECSQESALRLKTSRAVAAPCAVAHFPKEAPFPPREWVERGYNIQRWTEMPRGGHFAAAEEPELLAADIRACFRSLRT